jgi:peptidoglycan/LPS O-acetylase OafA/YrhL
MSIDVAPVAPVSAKNSSLSLVAKDPYFHFATGLPENLRAGLELSQLPALDGLRAVAAFLVVFCHFGYERVPGDLGVLMFFVLSGFLITWLLLKEDEKFGTVSLPNFYIRRSLRIFPAFYAYVLFYVGIVTAFHKRLVWGQVVCACLYVSNYYHVLRGDPDTGLSHTWSLGIEEQFYLLWALAFVMFRRPRGRLAWLLAGSVLVIWIYRAILYFVFHTWQGHFYEAFDTRADHLLVGCLLAVVLRAGFTPGFWRAVCAHVALSLPVVGLLLLSVALRIKFGPDYRDTAGFMIDPVLVALLIVQLIAFRGKLIWAWLNVAPVRFLGRISYSIYLYQQITLQPVRKYLHGSPVFFQLVIALAVVVLVASTSYYLIEKPFLRLRDRFRPYPPSLPS